MSDLRVSYAATDTAPDNFTSQQMQVASVRVVGAKSEVQEKAIFDAYKQDITRFFRFCDQQHRLSGRDFSQYRLSLGGVDLRYVNNHGQPIIFVAPSETRTSEREEQLPAVVEPEVPEVKVPTPLYSFVSGYMLLEVNVTPERVSDFVSSAAIFAGGFAQNYYVDGPPGVVGGYDQDLNKWWIVYTGDGTNPFPTYVFTGSYADAQAEAATHTELWLGIPIVVGAVEKFFNYNSVYVAGHLSAQNPATFGQYTTLNGTTSDYIISVEEIAGESFGPLTLGNTVFRGAPTPPAGFENSSEILLTKGIISHRITISDENGMLAEMAMNVAEDAAEEAGITVFPIVIRFGTTAYWDASDVPPEEAVTRPGVPRPLRPAPPLPTVTFGGPYQPNSAQLLAEYDPITPWANVVELPASVLQNSRTLTVTLSCNASQCGVSQLSGECQFYAPDILRGVYQSWDQFDPTLQPSLLVNDFIFHTTLQAGQVANVPLNFRNIGNPMYSYREDILLDMPKTQTWTINLRAAPVITEGPDADTYWGRSVVVEPT